MTDNLYRTGARDAHTARVLKGYAKGGAIDAGDKKAVHAHERHMHPGEKETKLAKGGRVKAPVNVVVHAGGAQTAADMGRQQGVQQGMRMGAALGARAAAAKMAQAGGGAPRPGMAGPMMGGPPPQSLPGALKSGGRVKKRDIGGGVGGFAQSLVRPAKSGGAIKKLDAGAGSGIGRLEKAGERIKVRAHTRRKSGGKIT